MPGKRTSPKQRDLLLFAPLRHFLDVQEIEGLQQDIRGFVAVQDGGEIDLDELGLAGIAAARDNA